MVPHLVGLPTFTRELPLHEYLKSTPPQIELPLENFQLVNISESFQKVHKELLLSVSLSAFWHSVGVPLQESSLNNW